MANISEELAFIMAAVHGKDVRKSIHDAIRKINTATEVALLAGTDVDSESSSTEGYDRGSLYINKDEWVLWQCQEIAEDVLQWRSLGKFGGQDGNAVVSIDKIGTDPENPHVDIYQITYSDSSPTEFRVTNGIDGTHGSVWYRGTALTGPGTVYGYPGVATDMYMNSQTGEVYQCIRTGDGTTSPTTGAQWDYVMTISGGGGGNVTYLEDLDDVTFSNQQPNQKMRYNGSIWGNVDDDLWTEPQTCDEGDTSKTFTGIDATRAYDAYFECPAGVQSPAIISMYPASANSITVTFKPVTQEQAGTGSTSACKLKLRGLGA